MTQQHANAFNDIVNIINQHGTDALAQAFTRLINTAMLIEREQYLNAKPRERSQQRNAYANGTKPKALQLPVGSVTVDVPKTRSIPGKEDGYQPFYPNALQRGTRTCKTVAATIAQMYLQGVSTRDVRKVLVELGLENVTSQQVSRAVADLDDELERWRTRSLSTTPYLILDARYEKVRVDGIVRDVAVLSAVGVTPDGHRRVLGISVALSEAEAHWRDFWTA